MKYDLNKYDILLSLLVIMCTYFKMAWYVTFCIYGTRPGANMQYCLYL